MGKIKKLEEWKSRYDNSKNAYSSKQDKLKKHLSQYDGTMQPEKGRSVKTVYNFTKELIETEINNDIPLPKVEPFVSSEKNMRLANIIENMIRGEIKKLELTEFNDINERNAKIFGADIAMLDWDNTIKTHYTVGGLQLKNISPIRFVPQPNIEKIEDMDYIFIDFNISKAVIKKRYGIDVSDEEMENEADESGGVVIQHFAFYKNGKDEIGCFSWVGDTVIVDEISYNARQVKVCKCCGLTKPVGAKACICGSRDFEKRNLKYEELSEDKVTNNLDENGEPVVIPKMSYARENGKLKTRAVEREVSDINPVSGMLEPVYEQIFDDKMNVVGSKVKTETEDMPYLEPTKVPYYVPQGYPAMIRKNISEYKNVLGSSDCEFIRELQMETNKLATRVIEKVSKQGSILVVPRDLNYSPENTEQVLEIESPDQMNMIAVKDINFDTSRFVNLIGQNYLWAKSSLGINESFQGKTDSSAISGTAKESQISRALGRQESKLKMKYLFYAQLFKKIFEFMLAYADEPRRYTMENQNGDTEEIIFDRYDFLEKDEYDNWYYNDEFVFSVDTSGNTSDNRQYVLESMQKDFMGGLYGNTEDPETLYNFWKDRAEQGYPNAKRQVGRWKLKVEEKKRLEEEQRQMQEQMQAQGDSMGEGIDEPSANGLNTGVTTNKDLAPVTKQMKNSVTGQAFGMLGGR